MHFRHSQSILDSIRRIVRALRVGSRRSEVRLGLSGAQLFVLQALKDGSPRSINELAEQTFTHQSSVSTVAKRLEAVGLIRRERSRSDGRCREVRLTPKGKGLLDERIELGQFRLLAGLSKLKPAERRRLAELLEKMVRHSELAGLPPTMFFEGEKA